MPTSARPHRTSCYANASGGALSVTSDRKYPKNAAKTNGFGILARAWCGMYRGLSSPRIKQYKSVPCFRIVSGSIHRDALRACAARPNRAALCVYRPARCGERIERRRWRMKRDERVAAVKILSVRRKAAQKFGAPQQGHRALRSSIGKRCVGADAYSGPLTALLAMCHCEPVRKLVVAIRIPVPLPKGPWHGEAVTGGFRSAAHFWGRGIPLILFILSHFPKKARLPL